jgi:hypothetical protein
MVENKAPVENFDELFSLLVIQNAKIIQVKKNAI